MTTETQTNTPAANTIEAFMLRASEAGRATANGVDGIMSLAVAAYDGAAAKLIDKTNIRDLYKAYLIEANGSKFGTRVALNDKTLNPGVSKLRRFVKLATSFPGKRKEKMDFVTRVAGIIRADLKDKKVVGSTYELIGRVIGKTMHKDNKAGLKVSDKTVREWLAPKEKDVDDVIFEALSALLAKAEAFGDREEEAFVKNSSRFAAIVDAAREQLEAYKADSVEDGTNDDDDEDEEQGDSLADAITAVQQEVAPTEQQQAA